MQTRIFIILSTLILVILQKEVAKAQYFQKFFGESGVNESGIGLHQMPDGSIFVVGSINPGSYGETDVKVYKLGRAGEIIWSKEFGTPDSDFPNSLVFNDHQLVIVGEKTNSLDDKKEGFLLIVDTLGNEKDYQIFGEAGKSVQFGSGLMVGSNFFAAGFTGGIGFGNDIYVFNRNLDNNDGWFRTFGDTLNEIANAIALLPNGNLVVACDKQRPDYQYNVQVLCLDQAGETIWNLDIPVNYNGGSKKLIVNKAGNIVVVGEMNTPTSQYFDMYFLEISPDGDLIFETWVSGTERGEAAFGVAELPDVGYLLTGYGHNAQTNKTDIPVVSIDPSGKVLARKFFGGDQFDIGYDIKPGISGGFLLTGNSIQSDGLKMILVYDQINSVTSSPVLPDRDSIIDIQIISKNGNKSLVFNNFSGKCSIWLSDVTGRNALIKHYKNVPSELPLPAALAPGIYFLSLKTNDRTKNISFYLP